MVHSSENSKALEAVSLRCRGVGVVRGPISPVLRDWANPNTRSSEPLRIYDCVINSERIDNKSLSIRIRGRDPTPEKQMMMRY